MHKKIPTLFSGRTFDTHDSEDFDSFSRLSDQKKWDMGFWVERQSLRSGWIYGTISGFISGLIVGFVVTPVIL